MKKLAFLAMAVIGLSFMAATCVIKGATVTTIDDDVFYSAEMKNETSADILNHKFAVGFIEGSDAVATKTVDGCLRSLQSGNSNFFSANSGLAKNDVDTAVSRLVGPLTFGQVVNGDLSFSNVVVTRDQEDLVVTGKITNDDNDDLEDVRVCAVVRSNNGDVTRAERDNDTYDLKSDASANFSLSFKVPDDDNEVDTVDLWADATNKDKSGDVTEPQSDLDNNVDECDATNTPTKTATGTPATSTPTNTATTVPPTNTPTVTPGAGTPTAIPPTNTATNTPTKTATPNTAC